MALGPISRDREPDDLAGPLGTGQLEYDRTTVVVGECRDASIDNRQTRVASVKDRDRVVTTRPADGSHEREATAHQNDVLILKKGFEDGLRARVP
jgi:hypothetical protein